MFANMESVSYSVGVAGGQESHKLGVVVLVFVRMDSAFHILAKHGIRSSMSTKVESGREGRRLAVQEAAIQDPGSRIRSPGSRGPASIQDPG